ncbi:hypothetical protein [Pseudomonas fulva]|uniref:hypothetical protein n=2 Tax=Pseudomonas TaxID=286 RepID=UPI0015E3B5A9|nr:hypothetical protein [Pseudomonas fulva]MBA1209446.1 hypothetical protein [Pseudomonas fulva]MDH0573646.1 hypothetical protein [Pseudomonas fulva]
MSENHCTGSSVSASEEVQDVLRALRANWVEEFDGGVKLSIRGSVVVVTTQELELYKAYKSSSGQNGETSIFSDGYFEQAIEVHSNGPGAYRLFRDDRTIVLDHDQTGFQIELSPISSCFVMSLADTDDMSPDLKRLILTRTGHGTRGRGEVTLSEFFSRFMTVKVRAPEGHAYRKNAKQLRLIAEAGLYHISYGSGVGLVALKSWERSLFYLANSRTEDVQFPLQTYNLELVAYYQMALGAESLVLSYLALYKILEYFYTEASEHVLHRKMKEHLVAPEFSHSKVSKLRELAKVIRSFDSKMNEKAMLQTVLEQHVDKENLRSWVESFEGESGSYFTTALEVFGKPTRVDLADNQIFPTISTRIYQIRNALVHNKEGEESRFTPFAGQERILIKETPLLLRIAEELIQRTGKDLQL